MNRMLKHSDKAIASRATAIQGSLVNADRQAVLDKYRAALALEAFPKRGEIVFRKNCATCHKIGEIGVQVAPDISDSRTRQPIQILTDILNRIERLIITICTIRLSSTMVESSIAYWRPKHLHR